MKGLVCLLLRLGGDFVGGQVLPVSIQVFVMVKLEDLPN